MKNLFYITILFTLVFLMSLTVSAEKEVVGIEVVSGKVTCLENAYGEYIDKIDFETGEREKIYRYDFIMPDDVIMKVNYSDNSSVIQSINKSVDNTIFKWFGNYQLQDPWTVNKENYITVEYKEFTALLPVELIPNPISRIETVTAPEREYIFGDGKFGYYDDSSNRYSFWPTDLKGFCFKVYFKDGREKTYSFNGNEDSNKLDGYLYRISNDSENAQAGRHNVSFYYMGHTAQYSVLLKYKYSPFPDVPEDSWYNQGVEYCASLGYIKGTDKGNFEPLKLLTREEFVVILSRVMKADTSKYTHSSFNDVNENSWYASAVEWAKDNNITEGVGNNRFGVGSSLSRQETATLLYRISSHNSDYGNEISVFLDCAKAAVWAKDALNWAIAKKILGSTSKDINILAPAESVTRAQAAKIIASYDEHTIS
ncbi:MAG: S-layer homology domain-containing protein [Clostridia bacterium]|nr:S-layer homology domain-containing protein [Clostridia bacterium]